MENKQPAQMDQKRLVRLFKDIKKLKSDENRFCFLIGAGASKSSGIKTGGELSQEWYNELKEDLSEDELQAWEESIAFDEDHIGSFYSQLYKKRYETSPQMGYEKFKNLMEHVEPGLGYVILSQIITKERHNFVITTNFDYLIEDSVRMYTPQKPFAAGHETLAEFVSSQTERPTIIKVHRDLFLHPFNDDTETQKLKEEWKKALEPILKSFSLIVLGYGGNDGSLMDYLCDINSENRKPIYWCIRNKQEINERINKLLSAKDYIVHIKGFDELMISLNNALEYDTFEKLDTPEEHPFVLTAHKRISDLNSKLKDLIDKLSKDQGSITKDTKEIFTGEMQYLINAYLEKDDSTKERIYLKALEKYPNNQNLLSNYATLLANSIKDFDKAEQYFIKCIEAEPSNANSYSSYAYFLSNNRKEYDKAENYYKKALELDPENANLIGDYANLLYSIRKNYDKAEEYYKKAIELDPENATITGNYAILLHNLRKDYDKAEEYYKKAIELEPEYANLIGNYAILLYSIRKDYDKAEEYYKKAIELDPENARLIGNYANFLSTIRKNYNQAEEYYKKVIELDPSDSLLNGNYAHYIIITRKDFELAEKYINQAFELVESDNLTLQSELWFYRYAHYSQWFETAEKELEKLIAEGAKSPGWNLDAHVEIAKSNHHSNVQKLQEFADRITK